MERPAPGDVDSVLSYIEAVFRRWGGEAYLGEPVTMAQHMLQAADFAERANASEAEIAAALLHDLGHFLVSARGLEDTEDLRHETVGADLLERYFPASVVAPVRHHVAAKRYLCAVEPDYLDTLSAASVHSLALQGGPMNSGEVRAAESLPWWSSCVRVRRWDEMAKDPARTASPIAHYRPLLESLVIRQR